MNDLAGEAPEQTDRDRYVADAVARFGPFSDEQRARIAVLLNTPPEAATDSEVA